MLIFSNLPLLYRCETLPLFRYCEMNSMMLMKEFIEYEFHKWML